jgi:nitroreductase
MDYFELLKYRKSTRKFSGEQISQNDLSKILFAANAAPVGSAMYKDIHLTVVQNNDLLVKLSEAAIKRSENKVRIKEILGDFKPEIETDPDQIKKAANAFYSAPTVIFVSHRKQAIQPGIEFSNVACIGTLMHLAATDLGLGSVFMWHILESMREIPELDNSHLLNLPAEFVPLIGLAIGHPLKQFGEREIEPNKINVNYL